MRRILEFLRPRRLWRFISEDVWDIELGSLSALRRFGVKLARVTHMVFRGFKHDECPLHATALTFNTLIAIVPILALSLALAKGFGAGDTVEHKFRTFVRDQIRQLDAEAAATNTVAAAVTDGEQEGEQKGAAADDERRDDEMRSRLAKGLDGVVTEVFRYVNNVNFAALGGVGLAILIWTVIRVLGQVESSFNRVWGLTSGRPLLRKFTDYVSVIVVLPILLMAASSVPIMEMVSRVVDKSTAEALGSVARSGFLRGVTSLLTTSLTFAFIIAFMPNTRVRGVPALAGGLIAAVLFILWLWICAKLQVGAVRAHAIYGGFAAVPIVLAWVYVSWEIILLGAEVAFALQNCTTYQMEREARRASLRSRTILALSVVSEAARAMVKDEPSFDTAGYARTHHVPIRFVNDVVGELCQAGFVVEVAGGEGHFVLRRAPELIRVKDVMDTVGESGAGPEALGLREVAAKVDSVLKRTDESVAQSLKELTVKDLVSDD